MKNRVFISQKDNYQGNFGEVLRSSAIFYVINSKTIKTTISFSNYWKYKNNLDVCVILNLRNLKGKLFDRKLINFDDTDVCNYSPPKSFEGSVEVEVFSIVNMRIPYAAIMAVYEANNSISMVHSYARIYSAHEIEEKRTIVDGEESCWTVRDTGDITSFAVIHNGATKQKKQKLKLGIRNSTNAENIVEFEIGDLEPYETFVVEPKKYFHNIIDWLNGKPGNARISFKLNGSFTRMLCGNKANDESQFQITHSNFNYSIHKTDTIKEGDLNAYMLTPNIPDKFTQDVIVYPDTSNGEYLVKYDGNEVNFSTGEMVQISYKDCIGRELIFNRKDKILPTRIVTGLRINSSKHIIPAECSLGVVHHNRMNKHFHWMIVSEKFNSVVSWVEFNEVYGDCPNNAEFVFKIYSPNQKEAVEKKYLRCELPDNKKINLCEIFDESVELKDEFGCLTVWCSYGGLMVFSSLEKKESFSIEHSF